MAVDEVFTGAGGFRITVISEPEPDVAARELLPEAAMATEPRFLCFLFFVLQCRCARTVDAAANAEHPASRSSASCAIPPDGTNGAR